MNDEMDEMEFEDDEFEDELPEEELPPAKPRHTYDLITESMNPVKNAPPIIGYDENLDDFEDDEAYDLEDDSENAEADVELTPSLDPDQQTEMREMLHQEFLRKRDANKTYQTLVQNENTAPKQNGR